MKTLQTFFIGLMMMCIAGKAYSQIAAETFTLNWPAAAHWKIADEQDDAAQHSVTLVHANETTDVWTELANMTTQKGITGVPVEAIMKQVTEQAKKSGMQKPVATLVEKDTDAEAPWILFTIATQNDKRSSSAVTQLWYAIQGKENLYLNFIALKQVPPASSDMEKWTAFFKSGKLGK